MFRRPKLAGERVEVEALYVTVTKAPDGRPGVAHRGKRIVGRDSAIVADPVNLAQRTPQVLSLVCLTTVADAEEQVLIAVEEESGAVVAVVVSRVVPWAGSENIDLSDPCPVANASPHHDGHRGARRLSGFGIGEIEPS